jgi:hypothetical protein
VCCIFELVNVIVIFIFKLFNPDNLRQNSKSNTLTKVDLTLNGTTPKIPHEHTLDYLIKFLLFKSREGAILEFWLWIGIILISVRVDSLSL